MDRTATPTNLLQTYSHKKQKTPVVENVTPPSTPKRITRLSESKNESPGTPKRVTRQVEVLTPRRSTRASSREPSTPKKLLKTVEKLTRTTRVTPAK